jgi:hypothetical protein
MGYTTTFKGTLSFVNDVSAKQLAKLHTFFGEDARDHKEWGISNCASYIDLRLAKDFSGIEWDDGTEKNYGMVEAVTMIVREMRKEWPDFGLTGSFLAQGEDSDDRWMLVMNEDGTASRNEIVITGQKVECPDCGHKFRVESVG